MAEEPGVKWARSSPRSWVWLPCRSKSANEPGAVARALSGRPRLLLADEPTGNLDQHAGNDVVELIEGLNAGGITLVVVTHDRAIGKRATRRIRMVDGRIESDTRHANP